MASASHETSSTVGPLGVPLSGVVAVPSARGPLCGSAQAPSATATAQAATLPGNLMLDTDRIAQRRGSSQRPRTWFCPPLIPSPVYAQGTLSAHREGVRPAGDAHTMKRDILGGNMRRLA